MSKNKLNRKFQKDIHDPIKFIKRYWPEADISHITYDENFKDKQYSIIRTSSHDGTLLFTQELFQRSLLPLVNMDSYYGKTLTKEETPIIQRINYVIGPIKHAIVFGEITLGNDKSKKYPGMRERVRIAVRCEYFLKSR